MRLIDLGELTSAANGSTITLEDYGQYLLPGRTATFILSVSDDAALTAELEQRDAQDDTPAWADVSGSQITFAAGDVQVRFIEVTLDDPTVRINCSAHTTGKVRGSLLVSN